MPVEYRSGMVRHGEKAGLLHAYDPELDPAPVTGFESEDVFGGGTLRFGEGGPGTTPAHARACVVLQVSTACMSASWYSRMSRRVCCS